MKNEIKKVIENYVDGYLNADSRLVSGAFHSETILYSVDDGALDQMGMAAWIKNLNDRKLRGDIRTADFKLESVDVTDNTATAKLTLQFEKAQFTDYLSLLHLAGRWIIVGKIYSMKQL